MTETPADEEIPLHITDHESRSEPGQDDQRSRPDGGTELLAESGRDAETGPSASPDTAPEAGDDSEEEVEPVEVLVQLARDDEIDPWDIDVVRVTDKFLERIDESDLRTSGRALFYASVLVRMKSDALLQDDEDEPEDPWEQADPWEAAMDDDGFEADPFAKLETEMDRRLERKRARGMPQTLDELVRELRDAERGTWWKESREYDTSDSPRGFQRGTQELDYRAGDDFREESEPTEADVTGTAHAEDIDQLISDVRDALQPHYDAGRDEVLYAEIATVGGSRVETFLGLLFLSHRGQIRLQQDEFFGDLWIQDPAVVTAAEDEAAAD